MNKAKGLEDRFYEEYTPCVNKFFSELPLLCLSDEELNAVPSLFLPGCGGLYESSLFKIAVAGKETAYWYNNSGDSLLADMLSFQKGCFDYGSARRAIDSGKPAEWRNPFWQYASSILGKLFGQSRDFVLTKDNPVLKSIAWFNSHAIETIDSAGIDKQQISNEKMMEIQRMADESGLSDFGRFIKVFDPDVIIYFYRNGSADPLRNFPIGCEFVQSWGDGDAVHEYLFGRTLILQMRHTSWMTRGNMKQLDCAELVYKILVQRGYLSFLQAKIGERFSMYTMSVPVWRNFVSFTRSEADAHDDLDNMALSRHLILTLARELRKTSATMTAQTLVAILNEVDRFRREGRQYSLERRGPCACVRGAWNYYRDSMEDARLIAEAFTTIDGRFAYMT